jgi:apolipoprotein D and lipocalin family protein
MPIYRPLALCLAFALGSCATVKPNRNLATVPQVDLDRYMGRWEVIAYVPNFVENGKVATADTYARRPDGKLDNVYSFRKESLTAPEKSWHGVAWITNPQTNAEWKVQLLWPFTSEYKILELAPDYSWAVVASNGGNLLWILARTRTLPEDIYRDLLSRIERRGLDSSSLAKVPQPSS